MEVLNGINSRMGSGCESGRVKRLHPSSTCSSSQFDFDFYDDSSSLSSNDSTEISDSDSEYWSGGACHGALCACARPRRARLARQRRSSAASSTLSSSSDAASGPCPSAPAAASRAAADPARAAAAGGGVITREAHAATTPDGWQLHLHRVRASDPSSVTPRRFPVVLCPGLASGGVESYDLDPKASLAQYLAELGYDVWVPDLRGNGRSDRPSWWDRKTWWTVDDHLHLDLPTVISAVLSATGAPQIHWVGHSMGGMLAVGATSRGMPCAAALRTITLLASGCFGAGSWHSLVGPLVTRITKAGFYAGHIVPAVTRLRGLLTPLAWSVQSLFYVHSNVDPEVGRKLLGSFLSFIPSGVVAQFMGSLNSPLGISSADGAWNYADPKVLSHCQTPVLGINGDRDLFCPAAGGLKTVNLFGGPHRHFLFLGPSYGTTKNHYGHFCPLVGRHARSEVFAHIESFVSEFDSPMEAAGSPANGHPAAAALPLPVQATPAR